MVHRDNGPHKHQHVHLQSAEESHIHRDACFLYSQFYTHTHTRSQKPSCYGLQGFNLSVPAVREECQLLSSAVHE
jgi:hypothetical protein